MSTIDPHHCPSTPTRVRQPVSPGSPTPTRPSAISSVKPRRPLPPLAAPPVLYHDDAASIHSSCSSRSESFASAIDCRDGYACVVCRFATCSALDRCHLIRRGDAATWADLKRDRWLPDGVKSQEHESRNGLLMCKNCHYTFDAYEWFVRFVPERNEYVFVNFLHNSDFTYLHDQALSLDPAHPRAPFPSLFLAHELLCWTKRDVTGTKRQRNPPMITLPEQGEGGGDYEWDAGGGVEDHGGGHGWEASGEDNDGAREPDSSFHVHRWQPFPQKPLTHSSPDSSSGSGFSHSSAPRRSARRRYAVPLPHITNIAAFVSQEHMEQLGFRNWTQLDGDEDETPAGGYKWNQSSAENMALWAAGQGVI